MVSAPDRRELVRYLIGQELSERWSLAIAGMSASAYRYEPRRDLNVELREMICALANRHKRYGVGVIYLKLCQAGQMVNYKRVERLYQEANLQVRRRTRKKVPLADRQPLLHNDDHADRHGHQTQNHCDDPVLRRVVCGHHFSSMESRLPSSHRMRTSGHCRACGDAGHAGSSLAGSTGGPRALQQRCQRCPGPPRQRRG